jgi:hypothetical protein
MAKKPDSRPIPKDWGGKAAEEALKQRDQEKTYDSALSAISSMLEERRKLEEERNRPKSYKDLMQYAFNYPAAFPRNVSVSPLSSAAPYYGESTDAQLATAAEYAASLNQLQNQKVSVNPQYYEQIKNQIPVKQSEIGSLYLPSENIVGMMTPAANAMAKLSLDQKSRIDNNYGTEEQLALAYSGKENLAKSFRDTLEHESFHSLDPNVKFYTRDTQNAGYMGTESHLPTGLAKVQREQYAMTGSRFETPEQFKSFIINLAKSENPEDKMSGFTEEAKRSLRAQISNIRSVAPYLDRFKEYEESKGIMKVLKGKRPDDYQQQKIDFLEKSAQLIPALVSNQNYTNYTQS